MEIMGVRKETVAMHWLMAMATLAALVLGNARFAFGEADGTENLVPNGEFEMGADDEGVPHEWKLSIDPDDYRFTGKLSTESHSGRHGFCAERGLGRRRTSLASASFSLEPEAAYEVSVWVRMDSRFARDQVALRVSTDAGRTSFDLGVTRQWKRQAVTVSTERGTTSGSLRFSELGGLAERLYIDDVEVRKIGAREEERPINKTDLSSFEFPLYRPRLEHTAEEIEEIRSSMEGRDIHEHKWVQHAQPWLEKQLHFFEEGYDFKKYYTTGQHCPEDGSRLKPIIHTDGSTEMTCPKCKHIYNNEAQRACARALYNQEMAYAARSLGQAYALTGDERYARRAAEILVGFAGRYKAWGGGGHAVLYMLRESYAFLVPCTTAYDYIYDSGVLTQEDRRKIEEDFFRVAAEYYSNHADTNGRMNNRGAIHNHSVMCIGVAIADKGFVDQALNSPYSGFHALAAGTFDSDGFAREGFGYHTYTVSGLSPIAEMAYRVGVNVYKDPNYRRIFEAPPRMLLPGEEAMPRDYRIACKRFTEIGHPMAYPFGKEAEEGPPVPSYLFRDFGYGVLRSGQGKDQSYLSMTFGREAMFMGHAPAVKFGLVYYANGQLMTPMGAAKYGRELCGGWSRRALAHNTVNVDDGDQWGRNQGELVAFETTPRVQMMRATNSGAYGDVTLDRTLFLTDAYVVDLSGARADEGKHRYDLCYRVRGDWNCEKPSRRHEGPLGAGYGYQYLTNVRSARTDDMWTAHWRQDKASALRLSVLGDPNTEMITCTSPDNEDPDEEVAAVVARRWAQGTVFAAVWEPYRDIPFISQVNRLTVDEKMTDDRGPAGMGVEVIREGETARECFMAAYEPGPKTYGDIELDGELGCGRWDGEEPEFMSLVGGVRLARGGHSVEGSAPTSVYVERQPGGKLLVRTGNNGAGTLAVQGNLRKNVDVVSNDQAVQVRFQGPSSLLFAVSDGATYTVSGVESWHSVRLECEGAPDRVKSTRGDEAPVKAEGAVEGMVVGPLAGDGTLEGKNKVADGGFEINHRTRSDVDEPWECWSSYDFANFRGQYTYDDQVVHSGTYSLKLDEANWANEATRDAWIEQKVAGSGANKTYTLSAWVKASLDPTRVRLCVYGWDPNWGNDFEGGVSPRFDVGTEWQRISWTRTFGPDITDVHVMVKREHQVLGGDVWIDDVQLEEGDVPTDYEQDAWSEAEGK